MAGNTTRWKSNLVVPTGGTVGADSFVKRTGGGTVYSAWTSQGTAYKVHAGTAILAGGSIAVTTTLATILGMSANRVNSSGTIAGTAVIALQFLTTAGTAAIVQLNADGTGASGTCAVSWTAIGT